MRKLLMLGLTMICIKISPCLSQMIRGGKFFKDTSEISRYIDSLNNVNSFSGILAIAKGENIIYLHKAGYADKEKKIDISQNSLFDMGSINKIFTGVAIMQLVEKKKIRLSDPVSMWLPDFPYKSWAEKATIRNLLSHTSGLGDFFPRTHQFVNLYNLQEIIDTIEKTEPVEVPGSKMIYSNAGFYLLGRIIEKASGQLYFDYIQKNIFDAAGMKNTFFTVRENDKRFVKQYLFNEEIKKYESNENVINKTGGPAGGARTSIADLLAFQLALKNHTLLNENSFHEMTELVITGERGMGYGLGIGVGTMPNGARWIGHNGGAPGIAANYVWFPDKDYSIIVFMNQDAQTNMSLMIRSQIFVSGME